MATVNSLNTYIVPTLNNEVTKPSQPAFLAYNSATDANQTGNGGLATVIYDTEVFDQNADYNNGTGTFTAPVTGRYLLILTVLTNTITASADAFEIYISTSNRNYRTTLGNIRDNANTQSISLHSICDMDAADTATSFILVYGEAGNTVGYFGGAALYTTLSGILLV